MVAVFFLSYQEPRAAENFQRLSVLAPHAIRIHGVQGMHRAFRTPLSMTSEEQFYVVDGDSVVDTPFPFTAHELGPTQVLVWQARNAVNDLVYGYGGIKLFSRGAAELINESVVDVIGAPGQDVSFVKAVASTTEFNVSEFDSWKAGFREVAMLTHNSRFRTSCADAATRIRIWKTVGIDRRFGDWAIRGAHDGEDFALRCNTALSEIPLINDFAWLRGYFESKYANIFR